MALMIEAGFSTDVYFTAYFPYSGMIPACKLTLVWGTIKCISVEAVSADTIPVDKVDNAYRVIILKQGDVRTPWLEE